MSTSPIRLATIGSSAITERFLDAVRHTEGVTYGAAYSRDLDRAHAFGEPRGATAFYDDLGALAQSDEVDAVYVASPNGLHAEQALTMIAGGKHVLIEKALASNERAGREVLSAAAERGVVCLEAMRNLHTQGFANIQRTLPELGAISQASLRFGKVTSRIARLNAREYVSQFDPELSEGALMDIGVYVVELAVALFGRPQSVLASLLTRELAWEAQEGRDIIDVAGSLSLRYADKIVDLSYSKVGDDLVDSQVLGDGGTLLIPNANVPRDIALVRHEDKGMVYATVSGECETIKADVPDNDMICELSLFRDAVRGDVAAREAVAHFAQVTLCSLNIMDEARRQAGVRFPADKA
ncbi:Gfo/Idh/MocA family protein [Olsenella sp. HMSC062G07]|uniref:Gfo/Idh/MocA family protein n=1 Tax=Olsenella sp. HMSC062G07 TaxID=1739330 RepID=UPI0008A382D2|nr:Gfo/Idh/MocA family oxidoreductase [Olsenella sp. HMSC062G07]OFK22394.1 hypothetical protein HMPREF2826_01200 [Olsenella sp. HMSC062G07]